MPGAGLILLAAGASTRMGRPKQLLPWQGRTLLRHACEVALKTSCRPVLVVLGCQAEACAREIEGLDVTPVVNAEWTAGMGRSVAAGIGALERTMPDADSALLMLIDQPAVTSALLEALRANWSASRWPIVATKYPEGGGVPAIFARTFFSELRALEGDRGARGLIQREKERVALVDPGIDLPDLDSPGVYRQQAGAD